MNSNSKKLLIRLFIYFIICVLIATYILISKMGYGIPCFFYENFNITCPSCGATRAFISIMSLDFVSAIEFNPVFTLALYPILLILVVQDIFVSIYRVIKKQDIISILEFVFTVKNKEAKK